MKKIYLSLFCMVAAVGVIHAQMVTLNGYISDQASGEKLINANVYDPDREIGTVSNVYGYYSITLPVGKSKLQYSFVGYEKQLLTLDLKRDTTINISLKLMGELDEVTVHANKSKLETTQMSMVELSPQKLKSLPVLLGEPDVLKVIQLLPGVQSGSEGSSGIYVRGGGPDQNLFLLDGVPVYNANHLFGFFSVFNPSSVKTVKLYKGGFPARFGGRLSSVVDIRMKEGNSKKLKGEFSVGLISSRFALEGPIVKDKTSFIVSGRRTYLDILSKPVIKLINKNNGSEDIDVGYYFYDLNAKINHKFSDKSRLFLSFYNGLDKAYSNEDRYFVDDHVRYDYKEDNSINWGNFTTALRWNYVYNPKLFSNATLTYSNYKYRVEEGNKTTNSREQTSYLNEFEYFSGIKDLTAKIDFDYYPGGKHDIKFGVAGTHHRFSPGVNTERYKDQTTAQKDSIYGNPKISAFELTSYVEDNWEISRRLKMNYGLHFSMFNVQGANYASLEPRASLRYLASDKLSLKASYSRMSQYIHLLSSATISLPTDLWLPVTKKVKPQHSEQFALGAMLKLPKGFDVSVEGFYKHMDNLMEYKEGASFMGIGDSWESKIEIGKGWSYGAEFLLEKNVGKTTGWIGYTLSFADRKFDNLNFGKVFPARYDRRHDISVALTHKFSDRVDIGATWVYGTGNATTLSLQEYPHVGLSDIWRGYGRNGAVQYYGERNGYRMPAYHRLDVGINFHKKKKHGVRTWSFSMYNAYSRQNPFYLKWGHDFVNGYNDKGYYYEDSKPALKKVSLFPFIPSVSYSFKF